MRHDGSLTPIYDELADEFAALLIEPVLDEPDAPVDPEIRVDGEND